MEIRTRINSLIYDVKANTIIITNKKGINRIDVGSITDILEFGGILTMSMQFIYAGSPVAEDCAECVGQENAVVFPIADKYTMLELKERLLPIVEENRRRAEMICP